MPQKAPERTRSQLLSAAAEEIHARGYHGASLDRIVAVAGVTKGALYHHFADKKALAYAVVDETMRRAIRSLWIDPLAEAGDPIDNLLAALQGGVAWYTDARVRLGCPLHLVSQEMSAIDEGFRTRAHDILSLWRDAIASALRRGMSRGTVRGDVDPDQLATFFVASVQGGLGLAKTAADPAPFHHTVRALSDLLGSLRSDQSGQ
jgi:TetR/AcrR family transcriptional regulator, transcriptional repressor for nem operon